MPLFKRARSRMSPDEAAMLDLDLQIGGSPRAGMSEEEAESLLLAAWTIRRSVLMEQSPPGRRPGAWWLLEAREPQPATPAAEPARLRELGELEPAEAAFLDNTTGGQP